MSANGNMKPSGQASYLKMSTQNVKTIFMIFTVVFKVMIFKTMFAKLNDKNLEGSFEFSDIIAKWKSLLLLAKYVFLLLSAVVKHS